MKHYIKKHAIAMGAITITGPSVIQVGNTYTYEVEGENFLVTSNFYWEFRLRKWVEYPQIYNEIQISKDHDGIKLTVEEFGPTMVYDANDNPYIRANYELTNDGLKAKIELILLCGLFNTFFDKDNHVYAGNLLVSVFGDFSQSTIIDIGVVIGIVGVDDLNGIKESFDLPIGS